MVARTRRLRMQRRRTQRGGGGLRFINRLKSLVGFSKPLTPEVEKLVAARGDRLEFEKYQKGAMEILKSPKDANIHDHPRLVEKATEIYTGLEKAKTVDEMKGLMEEWHWFIRENPLAGGGRRSRRRMQRRY